MIQCKDYDYIELACLYNMHIKLHFEGFSVAGIARDIQYNEHRQQGIILLVNSEPTWHSLDTLLGLSAVIQNPYFTHLEFSN